MAPSSHIPRPQRLRKRLAVEFGASLPLSHGGFTVNVSAHGARIQSTFLRKVGERLHMSVRLPDGGTCSAEGRVVWAHPGTTQLSIPNEMGIVLLSSDESWFRVFGDAAARETGPTPPKGSPASVQPVPSAPPRPRPVTAPTPAAQPRPISASAIRGVAMTGSAPHATPSSSKAPPTLADLKSKPQTPRAPRLREVVSVRFGTDNRFDASGTTYDVSHTGCAIETLSMPPVGTVLTLEFSLPGGLASTCVGEVVRVRSFGLLQRRPNSMAVRFARADPAWRAFMEWRERRG